MLNGSEIFFGHKFMLNYSFAAYEMEIITSVNTYDVKREKSYECLQAFARVA